LRAIPERIFIVLAVMHAANQGKTLVVDGVATKHFPEEIVARTERIVGFIDRRITTSGLSLKTHRHTGQEHFPQRIINAALHRPWFLVLQEYRRSRRARRCPWRVPQGSNMSQRGHRAVTLVLGTVRDDTVEYVRRDKAAQRQRVSHQSIPF